MPIVDRRRHGQRQINDTRGRDRDERGHVPSPGVAPSGAQQERVDTPLAQQKRLFVVAASRQFHRLHTGLFGSLEGESVAVDDYCCRRSPRDSCNVGWFVENRCARREQPCDQW
jgi:hypothetical protein